MPFAADSLVRTLATKVAVLDLRANDLGPWSEYARIIGELRPQRVFVENVSALLGRGLGDVLGDLAAIGYDAEWHCIPAPYVGAPHLRDRIWVVAYPDSDGSQGGEVAGSPGKSRAATTATTYATRVPSSFWDGSISRPAFVEKMMGFPRGFSAP